MFSIRHENSILALEQYFPEIAEDKEDLPIEERLKKLTKFVLYKCTPDELTCFSKIKRLVSYTPNLTVLHSNFGGWNESWDSIFKHIPHLNDLAIGYTNGIRQTEIKPIVQFLRMNCHQLTRLCFHRINVEDDGLSEIKKLTELQKLGLNYITIGFKKMTNKNLAFIKSLRNLRVLELKHNTQLTYKVFKTLRSLKKIVKLDLRGTSVGALKPVKKTHHPFRYRHLKILFLPGDTKRKMDRANKILETSKKVEKAIIEGLMTLIITPYVYKYFNKILG